MKKAISCLVITSLWAMAASSPLFARNQREEYDPRGISCHQRVAPPCHQQVAPPCHQPVAPKCLYGLTQCPSKFRWFLNDSSRVDFQDPKDVVEVFLKRSPHYPCQFSPEELEKIGKLLKKTIKVAKLEMKTGRGFGIGEGAFRERQRNVGLLRELRSNIRLYAAQKLEGEREIDRDAGTTVPTVGDWNDFYNDCGVDNAPGVSENYGAIKIVLDEERPCQPTPCDVGSQETMGTFMPYVFQWSERHEPRVISVATQTEQDCLRPTSSKSCSKKPKAMTIILRFSGISITL